MSGIASKNLYELLGNDPELDPDRPADPPVKVVDKALPRSGKRNAPSEAPNRSTDTTVRSTPRGGPNANDNAFRDRGVGADKNRSRGSGEPGEHGERTRGELGRGRGRGRGRGGARASAGGDRHSRTGIAEHEKQAAHGWGATDGDAELADEKAGEQMAAQEQKEAIADAAADVEPEEEDKTKSYAAYLAEQAEKKLKLAAENVRKPNEGSSQKFPEGKEVHREEEDFIAGSGGKSQRQRERKQKEYVELDDAKLHREAARESTRGRGRGRGDFRGEGRGRGEFRGGRGRGEGRGEGRGGAPRGGRGGARGGQSAAVNLTDTSAFPSLGS
ncbi:hypothetical protein M011DRAFT_481386 [Sporormia fimetaria CBS 119925]|uniref:Hyaluronan/mRNA-binding protein domain-containing protein n=1 Tax=Sporormia fimetaria CBS 119925 TaxID=1340428 RepID=A0A6A6UWV5_9PLEO|nr:hypothetical protein M011DRAFT_481386 [Sporormia fimetaria CBS 119925]